MNENIDLTKILKDCPVGWKLYSSVHGDVEFNAIKLKRLKYRLDADVPDYHQPTFEKDPYPIKFTAQNIEYCVSSVGEHIKGKGECTLFPSREQRDWSKFTAPWYKKDKFDPKTLKPFDRVLCKNGLAMWRCDLFSSYVGDYVCPNVCIGGSYIFCIPYNDETKHLVGTTEEAPEYYRYWEDCNNQVIDK